MNSITYKLNKKVIIFFTVFLITLVSCHSQNFLKNNIPLTGKILKFSDAYGEFQYDSETVTYKTQDNAEIEATILTPQTSIKKPGLIFVHMWARDRNTFWGLPEYLASHGYASINLDLRGHGNSKLPPPYAKKRIKTKDIYGINASFHNDILNAIFLINNNRIVKKNNLILIAASLGCPLGIIAVEKNKNYFIGMIHLAPSIIYFDVNCSKSIINIKDIPVYVIGDENDTSFKQTKKFFDVFTRNKNFLSTKGIGHGTDILYNDLNLPTIILTWIHQIETFNPIIKKLNPNFIKNDNE